MQEQKRRIAEDVLVLYRLLTCLHPPYVLVTPSRSQNALLQSELRAARAMEAEAHQSLLEELARRDESIARLQRDLLQLQETREALLSEVRALLSSSRTPSSKCSCLLLYRYYHVTNHCISEFYLQCSWTNRSAASD